VRKGSGKIIGKDNGVQNGKTAANKRIPNLAKGKKVARFPEFGRTKGEWEGAKGKSRFLKREEGKHPRDVENNKGNILEDISSE